MPAPVALMPQFRTERPRAPLVEMTDADAFLENARAATWDHRIAIGIDVIGALGIDIDNNGSDGPATRQRDTTKSREGETT